MLFTTAAILSLCTTLASAATVPKRQTAIFQSPFSGEIVAPTTGDTIELGVDFPFEYAVSNWCESAFSPFTVYLTQGVAPPSFENVTADGTLADGSFILNLGKFTVSNFGLPLQGSAAPPSSLNLPTTISKRVLGDQLSITVLQEFDGCPGHIAVEYSLTSVPVTLGVAV